VEDGVLKGLPVSSTRLGLGILKDSQCTSKHMNKIDTMLLHTEDNATLSNTIMGNNCA
jgi:hypothetical protein